MEEKACCLIMATVDSMAVEVQRAKGSLFKGKLCFKTGFIPALLIDQVSLLHSLSI